MANYSKADKWALLAQKEGYPARSVYKLKEIDEKFKLLKPASVKAKPFKVLDLGAAPGSWSLYILRKTISSLLLAVDLSDLSRQHDKGLFDNENFIFIKGDFTKEEVIDKISSHGPYDLIISDAAPATSGNKTLDSLRSLALAETVLSFAETSLAEDGNMLIKIFQGGESMELLKNIKGKFKEGRSFKPEACRKESFETYFLGIAKNKF